MKQDWPTKRLADVCQILGGATPSKKNTKFYGGDIPWATVGDMNVEVITTTEECITKAAVADCSTNIIPSGSIVMATRVGLGKVCVLGQDTAINQDLKGLTPKNPRELTNRWLYWWLKSMASDIQKAGTGATVQGVKMTFVQELEIPLPPLAEQKRIVALLDEAFAGINEAKAKAEVNLKNAGMLFKGHVQMIFEEGANGWKNVTIEEISTNLDSKRVPITKSIRTSGEFPYYGASGIVDYVESYLFEGDNLLVSEDGANLLARSTPIAFSVTGKYWVNNHAHILHFENMATQRFAEFYLESIKLDGYITGAAQPKLTQKALNSIPIPIPDSLQKQAEIVRSIESLHRETEMLTKIYERKMGALNELRTTLLTQAFAGELNA
jgi:type I restriction enzyme S subunit